MEPLKDRQTGQQTDRQTDRTTDRQTDRTETDNTLQTPDWTADKLQTPDQRNVHSHQGQATGLGVRLQQQQ